jgi:hypothetical protein
LKPERLLKIALSGSEVERSSNYGQWRSNETRFSIQMDRDRSNWWSSRVFKSSWVILREILVFILSLCCVYIVVYKQWFEVWMSKRAVKISLYAKNAIVFLMIWMYLCSENDSLWTRISFQKNTQKFLLKMVVLEPPPLAAGFSCDVAS